jgi:hypothetical protein
MVSALSQQASKAVVAHDGCGHLQVQKLFDISWKAQLRVFYPSTEEYGAVLANVAQLTGRVVLSMLCSRQDPSGDDTGAGLRSTEAWYLPARRMAEAPSYLLSCMHNLHYWSQLMLKSAHFLLCCQ